MNKKNEELKENVTKETYNKIINLYFNKSISVIDIATDTDVSVSKIYSIIENYNTKKAYELTQLRELKRKADVLEVKNIPKHQQGFTKYIDIICFSVLRNIRKAEKEKNLKK